MYGTQLDVAMSSVKKDTKENKKPKITKPGFFQIQRCQPRSSIREFARMIPGQKNCDTCCGVAPRTHPEAELNPMRPARWREIGNGGPGIPDPHRSALCFSSSRRKCRSVGEFRGLRYTRGNARVHPERDGPKGPRTHCNQRVQVHVPYSSVI